MKEAPSEIRFGDRIRYARHFKGLRLADLAGQVNCSESLLSKIENNHAMPSLALLHRVADKLDTTVSWILATSGTEQQIILRKADRVSIDFTEYGSAEGTSMERVAPFYDGQFIEAVILNVAPGGGSVELIEHVGEEAGYVIEGQVDLQVSGIDHRLGPDDAFQFRSERPHRYRNRGSVPARILWINAARPKSG